MRKFLKWAATLLGLVLAVAVLVFAYAWIQTERGLARSYVVDDPPLPIQRDAATLAHGAHLFKTRGCADCHGEDGDGQTGVRGRSGDEDRGPEPQPGRHRQRLDRRPDRGRHPPRREAGRASDGVHADAGIQRLQRHRRGGADVAHLQSLPASGNDPGLSEVRPLGRILYAFGKLPLLPAEHVDHSPRERAAPPIAATVEYGAYVAQGCTGCHGQDFAGQHVPGTPPEFKDARNITPASLGQWTEDDFRRALQQGKRPDGSDIDPFMPWKQFARMSDTEVKALWAFLQTVPAKDTSSADGVGRYL